MIAPASARKRAVIVRGEANYSTSRRLVDLKSQSTQLSKSSALNLRTRRTVERSGWWAKPPSGSGRRRRGGVRTIASRLRVRAFRQAVEQQTAPAATWWG